MIHLFAAIKMLSDTALWLAGSSILLSFFYPLSNLTLAAPLLGLCAAFAHILTLKQKKIRLLGILPGFLGIFLCKNTGDLLMFLPALGYLAVCTGKEQLQADQTQMYYRFKGWAIACLGAGLLCMLRHVNWGFWCCILSLSCYVFLMRLLRHDISDFSDRKLVTMELAFMAAVTLAIICLSQNIVLNSSLLLLKLIYKYLLSPILMAVLTAILMVIRFFDWLLGLFFTGKFEMDFSGMAQESLESVEQYLPVASNDPGGPNIILLLLKCLGVLLFLTAAFFLFRYLLTGAGKAAAPKESEDARQILPEALDTARVTPGILDRSPEARVRRSYASYCRAVSKCRRKLRPMDTTREVNRLAALSEDPDAVLLRSLYLRARYTRAHSLTSADARTAGNLARSLKNKLEKTTNEGEI